MEKLCDFRCLARCLWPYPIRRKWNCEYYIYSGGFTVRVEKIQVPSNFYTIRLQLGDGETAIRDLSQGNESQTVLDKPSDMAPGT